MKKNLSFILCVLFALSFTASAFAIHADIPAETQTVVAKDGVQITLGGEIRARGWYSNNNSILPSQGREDTASQDEHSEKSTEHANKSQAGK